MLSIALFLLSGFVYIKYVTPMFTSKIIDMKSQQAQLVDQSKLDANIALLNSLNAKKYILESQIKTITQNSRELNDTLRTKIPDKTVAQFLRHISLSASKKVDITSIKNREISTNIHGLCATSIAIECVGNFNNILSFVNDLEHSEFLNSIETITISQNGKSVIKTTLYTLENPR